MSQVNSKDTPYYSCIYTYVRTCIEQPKKCLVFFFFYIIYLILCLRAAVMDKTIFRTDILRSFEHDYYYFFLFFHNHEYLIYGHFYGNITDILYAEPTDVGRRLQCFTLKYTKRTLLSCMYTIYILHKVQIVYINYTTT